MIPQDASTRPEPVTARLVGLAAALLYALSALSLWAHPAFAESGQIVIRMYGGSILGSEQAEVQNRYLRLYEQQHPGLKIENLGREHDPDKLTTLFLAGEAPDVIEHSTGIIIDYYRQGLVQPVPRALAAKLASVAFPVSLRSVTDRGVLVGVPVENMVTGLWYSREAMATAGLAGPPETVDELERFARRASRFTADGRMETPGMTHTGDAAWALDHTAIAMLIAEGGQVIDGSGRLVIDGPPLRRVVNRLVDWIGNEEFFAFSWDGYTVFTQGKVAFGIGYPWWLGDIRRGYTGDAAENFGVALFPGGTLRYGATHYGHAYGVSAASEHPDEVWKLLEWLSLEPVEGITPSGHYMAVIGSLPINRNDIGSPYYSAHAAVYEGFVSNLEYAVNDGEWTRWGTGPAISSVVLGVVQGNSSPAEGIANLVRTMEADMAEYREYLAGLGGE